MARVESIEKVSAFCTTYDKVTTSYDPDLLVKVPRNQYKKGDLVVFEPLVARHSYKGHYFYGKACTPAEAGLTLPIKGQDCILPDEAANWGLHF